MQSALAPLEHVINGLLSRAADDSLPLVRQNSRLAAVRRKLVAGAPVCIRCIGGSVTLGAKLAPEDTPFPAELFRLLNTTYPHPAHDFDSFGGGGFGSKFYSSCLDSYVPVDVTLSFGMLRSTI